MTADAVTAGHDNGGVEVTERKGTWTFVDTFEVWPHVRENPPKGVFAEINLSNNAPGGGTFGEFVIRWYNLGGRPVPKLEAWDDGWRALLESGVLDMLAALDHADDRTVITLEQMKCALVGIGFVDGTEEVRARLSRCSPVATRSPNATGRSRRRKATS